MNLNEFICVIQNFYDFFSFTYLLSVYAVLTEFIGKSFAVYLKLFQEFRINL